MFNGNGQHGAQDIGQNGNGQHSSQNASNYVSAITQQSGTVKHSSQFAMSSQQAMNSQSQGMGGNGAGAPAQRPHLRPPSPSGFHGNGANGGPNMMPMMGGNGSSSSSSSAAGPRVGSQNPPGLGGSQGNGGGANGNEFYLAPYRAQSAEPAPARNPAESMNLAEQNSYNGNGDAGPRAGSLNSHNNLPRNDQQMLDPGSGGAGGGNNQRNSQNSHATFGGRGGIMAGGGPHNSQDRSRSRDARIINSSEVNAFAGLGSSIGGAGSAPNTQ